MVTNYRTKRPSTAAHTGPFTVMHAPQPDLGPVPVSTHRAESEWAPILGPLATAVWRRLTLTRPRTVVDPADLAAALGVKRDAVEHALSRCRRFGLVRHGLVASPFTLPTEHQIDRARTVCPSNLRPD